MKTLTYDQALAAHESGKKVEYRSESLHQDWTRVNHLLRNISEKYATKYDYEFRLAPVLTPEPEPLKIEAGKEYLSNDGGHGDKSIWRVVCTDAYGSWPVVAVSGIHTERFTADGRHSNPLFTLSALHKDAPAPYDNWDKVPSWHRYQFMSPDGQWFTKKQGKPCWNDMSRNWQCSDYLSALPVPTKYAPANFTGNSETSLQERPE